MQKSFIYKDARISYRTEGKGKPVVLLHGFGEDSQIFDQQIEFLKESCLLIIPDLPGTGKSALLVSDYPLPATGILKPTTVSIEDYADCIKALLEEEKINKCILLGHSMGGYITLAFAEKYPGSLSRFGLIHSSAFADNEEKKRNRQRGIDLMEQYGAYAFLKNTIPNLFSLQFKEAFPDKLESLIEASKQFSTEACRQYYTAMMNRPDRIDVLKGNPLPVLFVIGTEDVAAPLNDLNLQIHLPLCSYIHIIENVGHMSMWEAPELLNSYLLEFIIE